MKTRNLMPILIGSFVLALLFNGLPLRAAITKADNTNALGTATTWLGGVAPTATDIALWSGPYSASPNAPAGLTNSLRAVNSGTALSWQGIKVGTLSGTALTTNTIWWGTGTPAYGAETNISASTQSGNIVTITTKANHGYGPGQTVTIAGVTPAGYNGTFTVLGVPSATQFTYSTGSGLTAGTAFGTVESAIYIGGAGTTVANSSLTIGSAGIDMSAASHSVALVDSYFAFTGNQTWNLAAGRNLRFALGGVQAANAKCVTSGSDGTIDISGSGIVDANQGGSTGMADAGGFTGFTGKWRVNSGATLRGLRNGATAWGSNAGADSITLNGGTLAVGGISGAVGSWTWTNAITLATGTTSAIDEHNVALSGGAARYLKLNGAISGSGNLIFKDSNAALANGAFFDPNTAYILTGPNTMSGTVTIGGPTENGIAGRLTYVRVGGIGGADVSTGIGSGGSLGTATIVNNGILTFSLNTTLAVNTISGTGSLRVGYNTAAGSESQNITLSGVNTYSGNTIINMGTLTLGTGASIPNTANIFLTPFTSASLITVTLDASPAGGMTINSGQRLVGGPNNASVNNNTVVNGNVTASGGSIIVPGGSNTVNTLAFNNNLSLSGNGRIIMDVNTGSSDKITVGGDLNPTGVTTIQVVNSGGLANGDYSLIEVAGTLNGLPSNFAVTGLTSGGARQTFTVTYDMSSTPKLVKLTVGGSPAADLTWVGDGTANLWDLVATKNWDNAATSDYFYNNDRVAFTDSGSKAPPVSLAGTLAPASVTVNSSGNYTFSGTGKISGGAVLTNSGSGTVSILTANDFTGKTYITAGAVAITNEQALGLVPASYVADQLTLDGGALRASASLSVSSTNRGITLGATGGTLDAAASATLTVSNRIVGAAGTLTKVGAGTLVLAAANTYNGNGTIVNGGTVVCANGFALGQRVSGGTFSPGFTLMDGILDLAGQSNYSNPAVGTSNHFLFTDSTLTFGGKSGATSELRDSVPGHVGFGAGYQQQSPEIAIRYDATTASDPGKATISAPWYAVGTGAYPRTYIVQVEDSSATNEEIEFTGQMSGLEYECKMATIQKTGAGVMKISCTNYFSGLQVTEGTLLVNNNYALGADRAPNWLGYGTGNPHLVTVDGGTINLNGFNPQIGGLSDGGLGITTGAILNNGGWPSTLTVGYSPSNTVFNASYAGTIANGSSPVALVKVGTGTQTLGGANTYTGGTIVSNGALMVNGSISGSVTARSGATLGGTGSIAGGLTVDLGGTVSPGSSIGTLTLGSSPVLNGAIRAEIDRNGGSPLADQLAVTGNPIVYNGTLVVTNTGAPLQPGDTFQLFSASGYSGAFALVSQTPGQIVTWTGLAGNGNITVASAAQAQVTAVRNGSNLDLSWPLEAIGAQLQVQTNAVDVGLSTNWVAWPGSTNLHQVSVPIDPAVGSVFLRLVYPPQP